MGHKLNQLSGAAIGTKGPGMHPDGRGLYLQVKRGGRSWVFRFMLNGKARYMGLGPFPDVKLKDARQKASECRDLLREGLDPLETRRQRREAAKQDAQAALLASAASATFEDCARRHIAAHEAGWRNAKHGEQWTATLTAYAYPVFGSLPVQAVDTGQVTKALEPIWTEKPETAKRLRQRIEAVLNWATARGLRTGDNPARWRGHLDALLPKPSKVRKVRHHPAMPYDALPAFYTELRNRDTVSARALAFTILTAARSGETRGATWGEIDREKAVWTVPGDRIKSGTAHEVPLSPEALAVLKPQACGDSAALLFPNPKGRQLSDTAMRKYLQDDMRRAGLTVHGFRSTFRDWAAERTNFPREVAEAALAHIVRDKTEAAYQRGRMLERRRKLMEAWAKFCTSGEATAGKVVPIHAAGQTN